MKPKVTVIVPIYNVAQWLEECLNSILSQNYEPLEILCINDGSTDNSLQILEQYALKDPRVTIISQENHGLGHARNTGIKNAAGEYILFLDSDDMLVSGLIEKLVGKAESDQLDLLCFSGKTFLQKGLSAGNRNDELSHKFNYSGIYSGKKIFQEMQQNHDYFASSCTKMYKTAWIRRDNIFFPENILHEDEFWTYKCFFQASRAGFISETGYQYRIRKNSIMTAKGYLSHIVGYYRTVNLMTVLCHNSYDMQDIPQEFMEYSLSLKKYAAYIYRNHKALIDGEVHTSYEKMILADLEDFSSKVELEALYTSPSWKVSHFIKKAFSLYKVRNHQ